MCADREFDVHNCFQMSFCLVLVEKWDRFVENSQFFFICDQNQRKRKASIFQTISTHRGDFDVRFETVPTFAGCEMACPEHSH